MFFLVANYKEQSIIVLEPQNILEIKKINLTNNELLILTSKSNSQFSSFKQTKKYPCPIITKESQAAYFDKENQTYEVYLQQHHYLFSPEEELSKNIEQLIKDNFLVQSNLFFGKKLPEIITELLKKESLSQGEIRKILKHNKISDSNLTRTIQKMIKKNKLTLEKDKLVLS